MAARITNFDEALAAQIQQEKETQTQRANEKKKVRNKLHKENLNYLPTPYVLRSVSSSVLRRRNATIARMSYAPLANVTPLPRKSAWVP
jgi:hypothetical protein